MGTRRRGETAGAASSPRLRVTASQWRLFCAIELTEAARQSVTEHIARLRHSLPDVRANWERVEKLHLTLKFFGDVEQHRVPALSLALERAAQTVAPFTLAINGAGTFPPRALARVLWLGVQDASGSLARLHQSLESECAFEGYKPEARAFHPHITIARLRPSGGVRELAERHAEMGFPAMESAVNDIVLMRSEMGLKGSCYTALAHHGLAR